MYEELAVLAAFTFIYSVISGRVEKMATSGPIIFVFVGLVFGPLGLDWFKDDVSRVEFRVLVDLTLALILFIDAANADISVLRRQIEIPSRMLLVGLPGAIALGFGVAVFLFDAITLFEAAILATMLAATDAALGKAVVANKEVPARLREGLNCESGLNDGLCVPILLIFIALAHGTAKEGLGFGLMLVLKEIGIGAIVGLALAFGGAWLLKTLSIKGWVSAVWAQIAVPALAFTCFSIAQSLHGSGYIAAFTGGLLFGFIAKDATHKLVMPGEGIAESMAMLTWLIFGVSVIGQNARYFITWEIVVYTVLSLTVIRMLPVFLSLTGTGESYSNKLFLGWFGPRGLASIVFAIIVLNENLPGGHYLAIIVTCTVVLSLIAHGVSANPLSQWIARKEGASPKSRE